MAKSTTVNDTANARSEDGRKATEILKEDHTKVKGLFKEYRGLEDEDEEDGEKQRLFQQIDRELTMHAAVEEEIFYPAVMALEEKEPEDQVLEAREEHQIVKTLLGQLRELTPDDETFDAKMTVLMESVEHHAEEEEDEMFGLAKKGMEDEELRRLGALIEERKSSLESAGSASASSEAGASESSSSQGRSARGAKRSSSTSRGRR
jgi:hemerythrin superfamily protein